MRTCPTYSIEVFVGLRVYYTDRVIPYEVAENLVDGFVNKVKACVTVTRTTFYYVEGWEPGLVVGIINYPRFPKSPEELRKLALDLAKFLILELGQFRISIVTPNDTIMVTEEDAGVIPEKRQVPDYIKQQTISVPNNPLRQVQPQT